MTASVPAMSDTGARIDKLALPAELALTAGVDTVGYGPGALHALSAAVDGDYGSGDIAELPKFFREAMLQSF